MSEISAFGVEHTPITKAFRLPHKPISFKSSERKAAASAIRRSRAKGRQTVVSRKQNAAAEGTWAAKNPHLAKLKARATHRPHHSEARPADPKELSFFNANNSLRSYDVITKAMTNPKVHSQSSRVKTPTGTINTEIGPKSGYFLDKTVKSVTSNGKTAKKVIGRKWNKGRVALIGGSAAVGAGLPFAAAGLANRKEKRDAYRQKIGYDKRVSKSDAAKRHRDLADKNQRKSAFTALGTVPAAGAAGMGASSGMNRLDRIERGPVGRLNNKVKAHTGSLPNIMRLKGNPGMFRLAKKPVVAGAVSATSVAGLVAAGHYGNKADHHDKVARRLEGRKKNRSK